MRVSLDMGHLFLFLLAQRKASHFRAAPAIGTKSSAARLTHNAIEGERLEIGKEMALAQLCLLLCPIH